MPNTTGNDRLYTTPWDTALQLKGNFQIPASAQTYFTGQFIGRDSSGNFFNLDDTAKGELVGILQWPFTEVQVLSSDTVGDKVGMVERPLLYTALIAAAAAGDEGRKVYVAYNNQVSYSPGTNGNFAGHVFLVKDSTHVVVIPPWMNSNTSGPFKGYVNANAATTTTLTKWDVNKTVILPLTANVTVNLPATSTVSPGDTFVLYNSLSGGYVATLTPNGSDTINGKSSYIMPGLQYAVMELITDGNGNWLIADQTLFEPSGVQTQFGSAAFSQPFSSFYEEGNLYRQVGNPIAGNAADTTDDILGGITIPANVFDIAGRGLYILAQGKLGATANNKKVRIWINPTMAGQTVTNGVISGGTVTGAGSGVLLFDSTVQTGNNVGWSMYGNFFKYGAAGSNTQYFQGSPVFGTTHGGINLPSFTTIPENAAMTLVVTGSSSTTGAANDVVMNLLQVNAMN